MGPQMLYSPGFAMGRESLLYKIFLPWKHGDNQLTFIKLNKIIISFTEYRRFHFRYPS